MDSPTACSLGRIFSEHRIRHGRVVRGGGWFGASWSAEHLLSQELRTGASTNRQLEFPREPFHLWIGLAYLGFKEKFRSCLVDKNSTFYSVLDMGTYKWKPERIRHGNV
jgi:hypothetical protein